MLESCGKGRAECQELKVALFSLSSLSAFSAATQRDVAYSWESDLSTLSLLSCTCSDLLVTERWAAGWCGGVFAQGNTWPSPFSLCPSLSARSTTSEMKTRPYTKYVYAVSLLYFGICSIYHDKICFSFGVFAENKLWELSELTHFLSLYRLNHSIIFN